MDRKGGTAPVGGGFARRTNEIVLSCDEQHFGIAKARVGNLREEMEKILDPGSFLEVFPLSRQRQIIATVFKDQLSEVAERNVNNNIMRMERIMNSRVSTAMVVRGSNTAKAPVAKSFQSVFEMRRQVRKSMYEETKMVVAETKQNGSMEGATQNTQSSEGNEKSYSSALQHKATTDIVPRERNRNDGNTDMVAARAPGNMSFEQFLSSLEASAKSNAKAIEETRKAQKEESEKMEEWKNNQMKCNERLGSLIQMGNSNTVELNKRLDEGVKQNKELSEKVDLLTDKLLAMSNMWETKLGMRGNESQQWSEEEKVRSSTSIKSSEQNNMVKSKVRNNIKSSSKAVPSGNASGTKRP